MEIPKDVQDSMERIYGEDELLRRIATCDQASARMLEDLEHDIEEAKERRQPGQLVPSWVTPQILITAC